MSNGWERDAYSVANAAMERIENHEKVCSERYETIAKNQAEAKYERHEMHKENRERIDRLYNRAWAVAIALVVGQAGIIAAVVGFSLVRIFSD